MLIEKCSCMQYCKTARFRNNFVLGLFQNEEIESLPACLPVSVLLQFCCGNLKTFIGLPETRFLSMNACIILNF